MKWGQNDLLLLSTDGLYKAVPPKRLVDILNKANGIETKARTMIADALKKHEGDNITIVVAEFGPKND